MSNPVGELRKKKDKSDVEQSFLDFVDDKNLYIEEQNKLWEFWERGDKPFVNIEEGYGRANYESVKDETPVRHWLTNRQMHTEFNPSTADTINIYERDLEHGFLAEMAHGIQYARKENESLKDYEKRYKKLSDKFEREHYRFGDDRKYGKHLGRSRDWEEFFTRKHGWKFPVMHDNDRGWKWEEYDESTELGVKGSSPPGEFDAHKIIQPKLEKELEDIRKDIPGYKKDIFSEKEMVRWLREGQIPFMINRTLWSHLMMNTVTGGKWGNLWKGAFENMSQPKRKN